MPPCTASATSVLPTPQLACISPRKREAPVDTPAIQMSKGVDLSLNEANPLQNEVEILQASSPQKILSRASKLASAAAGDEQSTAVTPVKKGKCKTYILQAQVPTTFSLSGVNSQGFKKSGTEPQRSQAAVSGKSCETLVSSSAGSLGESDLSDDELDKLWPDMPKSSLVSKSLVLSMLDIEAEEADEGDDEMEQDEQEDQEEDEREDTVSVVSVCEDSPPSVTAKTNCHKPQANAKAKAPSKRVEAPPASATDIFGSPIDDPISGDFDNPLNPDSQSDGSRAATGHVELLNKAVFTAIPPILYDIVAYLRSSGIVNRLCFSELLLKYTACDEPEGYMPKLMEVLSRMSNKYAKLLIIDCLLFRGYGVYVNPLTADNKKIMFKLGVKHLLYPIFIMPVVEHLRLTGWVFDEVFTLFSTFVSSILNQDTVYAYMTESTLQFTSRPAKVEAASAPSTPQKSAQHSLAFGRPSPRTGNNQVRQSAPRVALQFSHLRHPHSLGSENTIPIYDGCSRYGNFHAEDQDWETIVNLPRLGVPPPLPGRQPDYSCAVEILPFEPSKFCVALFAILLGSWIQMLQPHAVTEQRVCALRITAATQANALVASAVNLGA
ncbi:hypothetical protein BDN71DRAFT_1436438 [Pleurotus eryngii]|uniref:Uncharacterized protein n=1 Tax=Pleurotus eryngii TaxID=5323 RepID=A0A9P6D8U8_PLEER|nr:hypothetical protein BDN71DRAFT_1436438 [Pleurotus eryngii]